MSEDANLKHTQTAVRWLRRLSMQEELTESERREVEETADWLLLQTVPHQDDTGLETVYLDLETTGLDPKSDEILEICVLKDNEWALVDTLVRPARVQEWPEAQRINHIAPADVFRQEIPTLADVAERIVEAVKGKRVVIYNAPFDAGFLDGLLSGAAEVTCAMRAFQEATGQSKFIGLSRALGHVQGGGESLVFHRAYEDCLACREVWHWILEQRSKTKRY